MNRSKMYWTKLSTPPPKSLAWGILIVATVGFLDAAYLTIEHYRGGVVPCSITSGCEQVLTSPYATIFGVPIALIGAIYYLSILLASISFLEGGSMVGVRYIVSIGAVGFLISLWLMYIQAFILHYFCQYCLLSFAITTTLFILSCFIVKRSRSHEAVLP